VSVPVPTVRAWTCPQTRKEDRRVPAVNVRMAPGRILIPDIAVITRPDLDAGAYDAADVRLVVEITSPSNAYVDRGLKPQQYAAAGIPHYLRVDFERGSPVGLVHALRGQRYVETARYAPGEITHLTAPYPVELDLVALLEAE
jgi:Uma2 family endonuclease